MEYARMVALADYLYENQQSDKQMFSFRVAPDDINAKRLHKLNMRKIDRSFHYEPDRGDELLSIVNISRELPISEDLVMDLQYVYDVQSKIENMGANAWELRDENMARELKAYLQYAEGKKK